MNFPFLVHTAKEVEELNPLLAYELERNAVPVKSEIKSTTLVIGSNLENSIKNQCVALQKCSSNEVNIKLHGLLQIVEPILKTKLVNIVAAIPIVRCAHARPDLRGHLLPIIYRLTGR